MATGLQAILHRLMDRYMERVPDVKRILRAMISDGLITTVDDIENDHIAFRTLGLPHLGIASLEKVFLHHGYVRRDAYSFDRKKLNAFWYAPPDDRLPRIFISELRCGELSAPSREIIATYTASIESDPVDALDLDNVDEVDAFLHQSLWRIPAWQHYTSLLEESEYAAWVIYNRYYLNHFTISVHGLPAPYERLDVFNDFLERHGLVLNDAGGKIKVSEDGLLLQSSTVAAMVSAGFVDANGEPIDREIAGSYVEFAERRVLPEFRGLAPDAILRSHRRDGFATGNADRIFESTFREQTRRK